MAVGTLPSGWVVAAPSQSNLPTIKVACSINLAATFSRSFKNARSSGDSGASAMVHQGKSSWIVVAQTSPTVHPLSPFGNCLWHGFPSHFRKALPPVLCRDERRPMSRFGVPYLVENESRQGKHAFLKALNLRRAASVPILSRLFSRPFSTDPFPFSRPFSTFPVKCRRILLPNHP